MDAATKKRRKLKDPEVESDRMDAGASGAPAMDKDDSREETTGIAKKLEELDAKIRHQEAELAALEEKQKAEEKLSSEREIAGSVATTTNSSVENTVDMRLAFLEKQSALKDERLALERKRSALERQRSALERQRSALERQRSALERQFYNGEYYAATSEYWKKGDQRFDITDDHNKARWSSFVRTDAAGGEQFKSRHCSTDKKELSVNDPYKATREAAMDQTAVVAGSATTSVSSSTQSRKEVRNRVWPTDIFGNKAQPSQEIAHLLPAGKQIHKEWINVAAAAVGIGQDSSVENKKKATRGILVVRAQDSTTTAVPRPGSTKSVPRQTNTGVVHFVSNKIRLANQKFIFDGDDPWGLLVPILTVEQAKKWRGEGYAAVFLIGRPAGDVEQLDLSEIPNRYTDVGLNRKALTTTHDTRDATLKEIECARTLLREAVLALKAMIANMSKTEIESLGLEDKSKDPSSEPQNDALEGQCLVPLAVKPQSTADRKPVCRLEFGGAEEYDKHPAPDPLLLALRTANIWGKMTGQRLLANGYPPDLYPDMTEEDEIAELAYYEAKFGPITRPTTWEELAQGLGQPNGYKP